MSVLALGLLCSLPLPRASAQFPCVKCPNIAATLKPAVGAGNGLTVIRNGQPVGVDQGNVGQCEVLLYDTSVSYAGFAAGGTAGGFFGGAGIVTFPNGSTTDVTPADMATTLVGNDGTFSTIPTCAGAVFLKSMKQVSFPLSGTVVTSPTDLNFSFAYNGTTAFPDSSNHCVLPCNGGAADKVTVFPAPSCTITPPSSLCPGSCRDLVVSFTGGLPGVTVILSGPGGTFTVPNAVSPVTFTNAGCAPGSGLTNRYVAEVIDAASCSNTCPTSVAGTPIPTCSITPPASLCTGFTETITATASGGTGPLFITIKKNGTIISGPTQGNSLSVTATAPAIGVTDTYSAHITDSSAGSTASTTCTCDTSTTLTGLDCHPCIKVYKQVVCWGGTNCTDICDAFSDNLNSQKSAIGASAVDADGNEHCPAFCYRIIVSNCTTTAGILLTNISVIDDHLGDLTACVLGAGSLANPGSVAACEVPAITLCDDTINIVTASANGITTNGTVLERVSSSDTNVVTIVPFNITCEKQASLDGVTWDNLLTVPPGNNTVCFRVIVHNLSSLPLVATINDETFGCASIGNVLLAPNGSATNLLCCVTNLPCPPTTNNTVMISAEVNTALTNICVCTTNHVPVRDTTTCSAEVTCTVVTPVFCRVTGGGRQDYDPNLNHADTISVCPQDVRYVTHGGQVGAPYGNGTTNCPDQGTSAPCSPADVINQTLIVDNIIGNVCIHGRWTHVRHVQGGLEGNFHARFYDTLDCACLAVDLNACGLYSPGDTTTIPGRCNPGDKIAGPEPRKAPANKIVFTGVGDWADPNGRRTPRSVLFRVDIEDRSEPGGYHPGGAKAPADRYRIRIWVLTPEECAELHGAGPDAGLLHFRSAIAACYGIHLRDGVESEFFQNTCADTGTGGMFFGGCGEPRGRCVRLPDIDDGGEMKNGNHQIHPTIKPCDPTNPQGPGLANSGSDCSNQ